MNYSNESPKKKETNCREIGIQFQIGKTTTSSMLKDGKLDSLTASNGWLEKWKAAYGIREMRIIGEVDVSIPTVKSWIERIPDLARG